jgi:hypothetical protein
VAKRCLEEELESSLDRQRDEAQRRLWYSERRAAADRECAARLEANWLADLEAEAERLRGSIEDEKAVHKVRLGVGHAWHSARGSLTRQLSCCARFGMQGRGRTLRGMCGAELSGRRRPPGDRGIHETQPGRAAAACDRLEPETRNRLGLQDPRTGDAEGGAPARHCSAAGAGCDAHYEYSC